MYSLKDNNFFNKFVIKIDSKWKGIFDNLMLIVSTYNTFTQAYYAAFEINLDRSLNLLLEIAVEFFFTLDFIFCFC